MATDSSEQATPGITTEPVTAWLVEHVAGLRAPLTFVRLAGGMSNMTFRVTDGAGRTVVLRRPPLGNVLPSAHDMAREHRILSALADTPVPVPRPLALCEDPEVNGAPFYVMAHVEGPVLHNEQASRLLAPERRAAAAASLIDVLGRLHAVDPETVGLGTLGRTEDYVGRQLRRWQRQWEASKTREVPLVERVHDLLVARVPPQRSSGIVHGDYRLGNVVLGPDGTVAAVLDWELCTLGDQLADLGWMLVYWVQEGEDASHLRGQSATAAPGFPTRREIVAAYAQRTGADVSAIDFYTALGYWKLACIIEGIHTRHINGAMGAVDPAETQRLADQVAVLAQRAQRLL